MPKCPPAAELVALGQLRRHQDDVLQRGQLSALQVSRHVIARRLRAGYWQACGRQVVVLHSGPLTDRQRLWVALLSGGQQLVALAGLTAARAHGLTGFDSDTVHVLVPNGARVHRMDGVKVHVSRRFTKADLHPVKLPACVRVERALVDAAAWTTSARRACAILAAGVQQRLTTPARLRAELLDAGRVRHRRVLLAVLADVEGGAHALGELDLAALCRRFRLPQPDRQEVRTDDHGRRRYLDATWHLPDGRVVVLEVDGAAHLLVSTYWDDMARTFDLVISGCEVVRAPSVALRLEAVRVAERLRVLLAPRPARQGERLAAQIA